jgi:hypothetical protein
MGSEGDWVQGVLHDPPFARSETNTRCNSIWLPSSTFRHEIFRGYKQKQPPIPITIP